MSQKSLMTVLAGLSWQINTVIAAMCYVGFMYGLPAMTYNSRVINRLVRDLHDDAAYMSTFFFLILAVLSAYGYWMASKRRDDSVGISALRKLDRKGRTGLILAIFTRKGYEIGEFTDVDKKAPVRFWLVRGGQRVLLHMGYYNNKSVSAGDLKEAYSKKVELQADGIVVVTTGKFSANAREYSRGKHIEMMDGDIISNAIARISEDPLDETLPPSHPGVTQPQAVHQQPVPPSEPYCAACGQPMTLKTMNESDLVWQCSQYPHCKHVMPY